MNWTPQTGGAGVPTETTALGPLTLAIFDVGKVGPFGPCIERPQFAVMRAASPDAPFTHIIAGRGHVYGDMALARREAVQGGISVLREFKRKAPKRGRARTEIRTVMNEARRWLSADPDKPRRKRTLILGCARSGTKYIADVLSACGLDAKHEAVGNDVTVGFMYACKKVNFADFDGFEAYDTILHQVRDPLKVIASCQTLTNSSWRVIGVELDWDVPPEPETLLRRCMAYWLEWNRLCAKRASLTYCVGQVYDGVHTIANLVQCTGVDMQSLIAAAINTSTTTNTREHTDVTWALLRATDPKLADEVAALAAQYGYSITDERRDDMDEAHRQARIKRIRAKIDSGKYRPEQVRQMQRKLDGLLAAAPLANAAVGDPVDPDEVARGHRHTVQAIGDIAEDDMCCLDSVAWTVRKATAGPDRPPFMSRPEPCLALDDIADGAECLVNMMGEITAGPSRTDNVDLAAADVEPSTDLDDTAVDEPAVGETNASEPHNLTAQAAVDGPQDS